MMKILKSKQIFQFQMHEGQVFDRHLAMKDEYDSEGRLSKRERYDEEGNLTTEESRVYLDGHLIEISILDHTNHTKQRTEFKYVGDKVVNEIEHYEHGGFVKTDIIYNEDGEVASINKLDDEELFLGRCTFSYNNGTKEVSEYDDNNFLYSHVVAKYDDSGREIETSHTEFYDENYSKIDQKVETKVLRTFDAKGNLLTENGSKYGKPSFQRKCEYNSAGNITLTEVVSQDVNYVLQRKYKYNSLQKVTEESEYRNDQKIYTKSVKYDAEGYAIEESLTQTLMDNFQEVTKKEIINSFY